jgi:hypothetical protein
LEELSRYMQIEERLNVLKILLEAGILNCSNINDRAEKQALTHLQNSVTDKCVNNTEIIVEFMELLALYSNGPEQ